MSLNGRIPAELSGLSALRQLRLAWNQLTGTIPAELSQLTQLQDLVLGGNQLTGAIPPELGSLGSTLEKLHLSGPQPLPAGIGLTGSIPPQLGNLSGLKYLYLDGNRLTGSIPTRLRWLTDLRSLYLSNNQLSGAIPTQLGSLSMLTYLLLTDNQLTGAIPTQLEDLHSLRKVYLRNNGGFTGCVPRGLRDVRYHDVGQLNLPVCAYGEPDTPATPLPTYTLTVTAGSRRQRRPGRRDHPRRRLRGDVDRELERCDDRGLRRLGRRLQRHGHHLRAGDVPRQDRDGAFTALPADRCATTTDADCIRAVYKGAPDDYAQVQDIPDRRALIQDRRTAVTRSTRSADHRRDGRPAARRLHPLLPPAPTAAGLRQSHLLRAAHPTGRHDLHLHRHRKRGWFKPDQLRPDRRSTATAAQARPEAGTRRCRGHDQLPGPDPALRHARHHRRRNHARQLRLPRDGRRRSPARSATFGTSATREAPSCASIRRTPAVHSRTDFFDTVRIGAQLRLSHERPRLRLPLQGDQQSPTAASTRTFGH